jgi:hypothetical protein
MARLRLEINLRTGTIDRNETATRRLNGENFATTIIREVGLKYTNDRWKELNGRIRGQVERAVRREIAHMARQYQRGVVGRGQRKTQFNITSAVQSENRAGILSPSASVPMNRPWPSLTPKYSRWKANHGYSQGHFLLHGYLGQRLSKAESWTEIFGPVAVRVIRTAPGEVKGLPKIEAMGERQARFHIGKIEVRALGKITANMVPALAGQPIGFGTAGRTNGLLGLVAANDEELAYHLGQNPATAPYRSTLEPFLGFVLTKAIPVAVKARVTKLIS